jgi:RNA polymerase sigma-70 factor (ECF subfamily)
VVQQTPVSADATDAAVIERSHTAPEAFGAIFDRHFDTIHGYLAKRVGSGGADDLAASTFTVAFQLRHRFRADATSARPWLFGIATNLLRNERRAERRSLETIGRLGSSAPMPSLADSNERVDLGRLLADLDSDQRDVLLLHAWEELSYEEIAHALSIPIGTVRSRLARARAHLQAEIESDALNPSRAREVSG